MRLAMFVTATQLPQNLQTAPLLCALHGLQGRNKTNRIADRNWWQVNQTDYVPLPVPMPIYMFHTVGNVYSEKIHIDDFFVWF